MALVRAAVPSSNGVATVIQLPLQSVFLLRKFKKASPISSESLSIRILPKRLLYNDRQKTTEITPGDRLCNVTPLQMHADHALARKDGTHKA